MAKPPAGYRGFLQSNEWKSIRNRVLDRSNGDCERCGSEAWAVHHKTYERAGGREMDSDLVAVCKSCHGKEHSTIFRFARSLKTKHGDIPYSRRKRLIREWWESTGRYGDFDQVLQMANDAWDSVKYLEGESPVDDLIRSAANAHVPQSMIDEYQSDFPGRVWAVCRALDSTNPGEPFWLSTHHAAREMPGNVNAMRVWRCLRLFCQEGKLELVEKGGKHKANRYRLARP